MPHALAVLDVPLDRVHCDCTTGHGRPDDLCDHCEGRGLLEVRCRCCRAPAAFCDVECRDALCLACGVVS